MILTNALVDGKICSITIENGRICSVDEGIISNGTDLKGKRVIPGLIDVHTHGCAGMDFMDADFEKLCRFYAECGTTSLLATAMTADYESLQKVCDSKTDFEGANILGFHLEGPYLSPKYKGAQNEKYIKNPSAEEFSRFNNVKMVTIAPELEGGMEFISSVSENCIVSIGHTECDYETACTAIENGANCLTHTYNAMPPLHHRNPGPIGAAIEKNIFAQLICDGFHISKPVVLATYRTFGAERTVLISDSVRPAGLPNGEYESGELPVIVCDGRITLRDGTIAGSGAMLMDCVRKAVEFGIPFEDAVRMATRTPAEMLGINKGVIAEGYDADLLVINDDMSIETVIIGGEIFN